MGSRVLMGCAVTMGMDAEVRVSGAACARNCQTSADCIIHMNVPVTMGRGKKVDVTVLTRFRFERCLSWF